ncbi:MAG: hypothetical protein U1F43_11635 [Myxococcota bacterium]
MKLYAFVLGATFAISAGACGKKAEPAAGGGEGGGGGGGDLPASCKKFLDTYSACIDKMPEAARGPAKDGLKQMQDAWGKAPKDAMESACKQAYDAAKGSMGAACPDVKWE